MSDLGKKCTFGARRTEVLSRASFKCAIHGTLHAFLMTALAGTALHAQVGHPHALDLKVRVKHM